MSARRSRISPKQPPESPEDEFQPCRVCLAAVSDEAIDAAWREARDRELASVAASDPRPKPEEVEWSWKSVRRMRVRHCGHPLFATDGCLKLPNRRA